MFEAHVLHLLQRYLGEYVRGLSLEALKISVWQGDVVLKDLQLKAEALNALKLPITVKAGFLGSIRLKVPWNRLGKEPVVVLLDRIFILAEPVTEDQSDGDGDAEKKREAKRRRIEEAELAMLEAKDKRTAPAPTEGGSWIGSLLATVVGNLKLSITNVHIRYEDTTSNPGHPFCAGITLAKLAAVTTDDNGVETFVASGALDRLRKAVELERLAVYHNPNSAPWKVPRLWEDIVPAEWGEMFEPGISGGPVDSRPRPGLAEALPQVDWAAGRQYLLQPIGGKLRYLRQAKRERRQAHEPFQRASVVLDEVALTVSEAQYCDAVKMMERVSEYQTRSQYAALRPRVSVREDRAAWWRFAYSAVLQTQNLYRRAMSWESVRALCEQRRRYITLYSTSLQSGAAVGSKVHNPEIKELDAHLEPEVIIVWRLLAHAQVESAKQQEAAAERERLRSSHWWSFGWGSGAETAPAEEDADSDKATTPKGLTAAEWAKINELLDIQQAREEVSFEGGGAEAPHMLATAVEVTIRRNAARMVDEQGGAILEGAFEGFKLGLRFFPKTLEVHVKLDSYGLIAPEGTLVKSVRQEGRDGALTARFVHAPPGERALDWSLSAGVAPCQVTLWKASLDRCAAFVRAGHAVSPAMSLETAAALESTLEAVRKTARDRVAAALEKRLHFALDLDIDAPKVAIPVATCDESGAPRTQLLLDFGHFTLQTDHDDHPDDLTPQELGLYSRFRVRASDISAWLVDGAYDWAQSRADGGSSAQAERQAMILPVLDKCGLAAAVHQIHSVSLHHPSTRIAARIPTLGFHFSPARYERLMAVYHTLCPLEEAADAASLMGAPSMAFSKRDLAGLVQVLTWTGIGKTIAQWQPRYAVHAGMYLYLLEGETARTYLRYSTLYGKQLVTVPPTAIGGWKHVVALCDRGADLSKVAESIHSLVLRFDSADTLSAWTSSLNQAIYRASAPLPLALVGDAPDAKDGEEEEAEPVNAAAIKSLFFVGVLEELTVSLSGRSTVAGALNRDRWHETSILQLRAIGGKVELVKRLFDLSLGVGLHSLAIEDVLFGHNGPLCKYIARSLLQPRVDLDAPASPPSLPSLPKLPIKLPERRIILEETTGHDSDDDGFADALEDFAGSPDSVTSRRANFQSPTYHDPLSSDASLDGLPSFAHSGALLPRADGQEVPADAEEDFVTMQIVIRQPDSPEYDRIDTQLAIQVATLEFYCNRPTVVALTEFGLDISAIQATLSAVPDAASASGVGLVVYGLEGQGKVRSIFQLLLSLDTARIYLNLEDGDQLAMMAEERIHMDLKVFPASIRIVASLGNLRIADLTLPPDHQYSWACDMRDPTSSSLVELQFESFSKDDDDYAGYEYALRGKLQAVRLIFLYRFVQELMDYFLALATPDTGKVVHVVEDAGKERLIKQSELDGAVALKLDIQADAPVIKMPKHSNSSEFMQLDLGHLQLSNRFEWRGGGKEEPSAVRLDIMEIMGQDLQFLVGIDGKAGRPMFEDVQGVTVIVKRPLRDLFKRLPEVETTVQIQKLRAVMSDKEYHVITACAASNIAETKRVIRTFRKAALQAGVPAVDAAAVVDASSGGREDGGDVDVVVSESSSRTPWTTNRVVVRVEQAELELFTGLERDASLASLLIRNLWHVYRSTSAGDQDVLVTLPRFTIVDNRASTRSEMRFMVGSAIDVDSRGMPVADAPSADAPPSEPDAGAPAIPVDPRLTMLLLDYKATERGRALVLRTQKPRVLVSLDFLLALTDFFVPSFHSTGGSAHTPTSDPIGMQGNIRMDGPEYSQDTPTAWLSPEHQLEVDGAHVSSFMYDGRGGALYLLSEEGGPVVSGVPSAPLILVGNGKNLRFRNVHIKGGVHLDACVHLGTDSSYSAAPEDGCVIEDGRDEQAVRSVGTPSEVAEDATVGPGLLPSAALGAAPLALALDVQAVGLELTFYDTTKWPVGSVIRPEKLLRARTDFSCLLTTQGNDQHASAVLKGMRLEGGSGLTVVDPFNASLDYAKENGKQDVSLSVGAITVRVTGNILRLLQRLQADLVATFHLGGDQVATRCTQFDRVWLNECLTSSQQQVAFWRPRVPPGYAIVGDCATSGAAPPSQSVMAVSTAFERVKRPVGYELVWCSSSMRQDGSSSTEAPLGGSSCEAGRECTVWFPVAPPGYVAVSCVAWRGQAPPPLSLVGCVRMDLLTSSSFSDCIFYVKAQPRSESSYPSSSIWRVENAFGSFMAHMDIAQPSLSSAYDLREFLRYSPTSSSATSAASAAVDAPGSPGRSSRRLDLQGSTRGKLESLSSKAGKYYSTVAHFERMWWDKGSDAKRHVSLWRPIVPVGYAMLGDYAMAGYEPPVGGLVMRDDGTGRLARPLGFKARAHLVGRNIEEASVWLPVAPPGYVALGCVGARGFNPPDPDCVRCVRMDLVNQAHFQARPVWESLGKPGKGASSCTFWRVENQAGTFMVRSDLKPPPWRTAFGLAELGKPKLPENIAVDVKTGRLSITAFDDFSGLMNPLADISISGTNLLAHGRPELLNAVMITSMAASTFNSALDAWEPAVEPWEGLLKWESNNDPSEQALPAGSRLRIAASSALNVNVSSAAVETVVAAQLAWRRNAELEEEAKKELQMALAKEEEISDGPVAVEASSALDQEDFARVTMENKLGTTIFVQALDSADASIQTLSAGECAVVRLPPPRFPELYTAGFTHQDEAKTPRQFVAVRMLAGCDLEGAAGVTDPEYLCALQVLATPLTRKGREAKVLPQRARTRCLEPHTEGDGRQVVRWEEVFLFEIPVAAAKSEVELTVLNQAANGGRGEPVGAAVFPLGEAAETHGKWHVVREQIDVRKGVHWPDVQRMSLPLFVVGDHEQTPAGGSIEVALAFFKFACDEDEAKGFSQRGVQLGLSAEGPWAGLRSVLALATYPERLGGAFFAVDVVLKQGLKFVELRSLVVLANELDCPLEVCICPRALLDHADASSCSLADGSTIVVEEQFENQRYQPIRGWGSKWPGNFVPGDPSRWSTRDGTQSSQDFINIPLPPGWEWTSDWHVDKVGYVDIDGWAYNMDFKTLRWPPPTVKSRKKGPFDFVRRRRWIRPRRRVSVEEGGARVGVGVVPSGGTIPLPWTSLQPGSDYCVQVRPQPIGGTSVAWHSWGRAVSKAVPSPAEDSPPGGASSSSSSGNLLRGVSGGLARLNSGPSMQSRDGVPGNVFQLRSLSKTEELLICNPVNRTGEAPHGPAWLSMEADAAILYNEINNPVHDWRLTVAAPLTVSNLLPVRAEYQIWEKPHRTAPVLRQRGVIESGASTQISSVDVRRPIFLSWWPQGAWKPERDLVLISDPTRFEAELPTSFVVANTRSGRKLRISVEHDLGDTDVAAKHVRLYVPYWLKNEAQVPLAYRLTEIEDVARGSKTPRKAGVPQPLRSAPALQRVIRSLEAIEDQAGLPIMLSLPSSEKVGLAVGLGSDGVFSMGIPFKAFEDQLDRIDLNAANSSGVYAKLSASVEMSSYGYERTKVIRLQPHLVFTNRLGQALYIKQLAVPEEDVLGPADVAKPLLWRSIYEQELVQVRTDSSRWSQPFSLAAEGMMHITLRTLADNSRQMIRAEIRNGVADSRLAVVFRACSAHGPHKVENRSLVLPIRFRQKGSDDSSWSTLRPGSSASFNWEDLRRERMVEVLVDGADPTTARAYGLDTVAEYPPLASTRGPVAALHASVYREGAAMVLRVEDWKPSTGDLAIVSRTPSFAGVGAGSDVPESSGGSPRVSGGEMEFHLLLDIHDLGISIVDHTPEELLFLGISGAHLAYSTGLAGGITRFEVIVGGLQIDNQLALTPMPVLMALEEGAAGVRPDSVLKLTLSMHTAADHVQNYPYIGVQFAESPWLLNVHEPLIWRLVEAIGKLKLGRLLEAPTTSVTVDPRVRIGLLNLTDLRFKLTLVIAPAQRPRGILGFWTTLVTSLGNTNEMQLNFQGRVREDIHMRHSQLVESMIRGVRNDVLGQPFHLLTGLDILGNLSSVVGTLSKGAAALSMDKKFIRSRQRQESKAGVEDLGDGLREGGEAFAKGLFRGVTGILTKPVEGFKAGGIEGFASGVARGVLGVAAQPVSGVLDLVSKTTDGFNAQGRKISAAITSEQVLARARLPRAIAGDSILRPYDEYKARGQMIMQLAERGTYFGQYDIFKERAKFATSDAYEDHFNLPKNRTLVITHRRVLLLQHPTSLTGKRPDLMKEACSITWHVAWEDLLTSELLHSKHDPPGAPHSRVVLHLRSWSQDARLFDTKEIARVVKCHPGTTEAAKIREAIQGAYETYGPDRITIAELNSRRRTARKPYAGTSTGAVSGAALGLLAGPAAPIAVPIMATFGAIVGGAGQAILQADASPEQAKHAASQQHPEMLHLARRSSSSFLGGQHRRQPSSDMAGRGSQGEAGGPSGEISRPTGKWARQFRLMWWDKGAAWSKKYPVSIWRPIAPTGCVSLGDVVQRGYEAPKTAMVYVDDCNGQFAQPDGYDLVWRDTDSGAREPVTIWRPRTPSGFVALGCVAVPDYYEPDRSIVRCVRQELTVAVRLGEEPLWRDHKGAALWQCSLWQVDNQARTFLARRDHQRPNEEAALAIRSADPPGS